MWWYASFSFLCISSHRHDINAIFSFPMVQSGETEYMQALTAVMAAVYTPLKDSEMMSLGQLSAIFRTLPTMKMLHSKLSTEFHEVIKEPTLSKSVQALAQTLMKHSGEIEDAYVAFCKGHEAAMHVRIFNGFITFHQVNYFGSIHLFVSLGFFCLFGCEIFAVLEKHHGKRKCTNVCSIVAGNGGRAASRMLFGRITVFAISKTD